jgi:hypothetical protein
MQMGAVQANAVRRTTRPWLSDLDLLVVEIAVPMALVNLVSVLTMMGWLSASWLPQWLSVACSVWIALVLYCGPVLRTRKE